MRIFLNNSGSNSFIGVVGTLDKSDMSDVKLGTEFDVGTEDTACSV